jgi:hypothetical protein
MLPCGHRSGLLRGRLVNYKDLEELDALMERRDHYALEKRGAEPLIWNELADSVPGLVAEVRRLNLQNEEMLSAIKAIAPYCKVKYGMDEAAVNAIERLSAGVFTEKPNDAPFSKPLCSCGRLTGDNPECEAHGMKKLVGRSRTNPWCVCACHTTGKCSAADCGCSVIEKRKGEVLPGEAKECDHGELLVIHKCADCGEVVEFV